MKTRSGGVSRTQRSTRPSTPGLRLAALLAAVLLSGCVVVPVGVFTKEPFPAELRQQLAPGLADRHRVRLLLGSPTAHKAGGQYWFYARSRTTWGVLAGTSSAAFTEEHWLAVQFDAADRVVFLEHSAHPQHCLSNGICMLSGLFDTPPSGAVLTAPDLQDQAARKHPPGPETCALHVFLETLPWSYRLVTVRPAVNGQPLGWINDRSYLFLSHPRGDLRITTGAGLLELRCEGGQTLYLKVVWHRDQTGTQTLSLADAREAQAALQTRRLALPD